MREGDNTVMSKLLHSNTDITNIINDYLRGRDTSSLSIKMINEFYESLPDIVDDKKEFLSYSLSIFNKRIFDEDKLEAYLNNLIKIVELTEKNIKSIKKELLKGPRALKIKNVDCSSKMSKALVIFTDTSKIIFEHYSLENEVLINKVILLINNKLVKKHRLVIRKSLNYFEYGFSEFIEPLEINCDEVGNSYYFKAGQLLSVIYILNLHGIKSGNIINTCYYPLLQELQDVFNIFEKDIKYNSSENICEDILKFSVYNLNSLPELKHDLNEVQCTCIKEGFQYMYNIIINNKLEIIEHLRKLFENRPIYLRSIIPKMYGLSEYDLRRQLYFIDIRFLKNINEKTSSVFSCNENPCSIKKDYFLQLATSLGDHIIQKGIMGCKDFTINRTWISTIIKENYDGCRDLYFPNYNLYDGDSGIALFLLYLGSLTNKDYFRKVALEAMENSMERINNLDMDINASWGIFKGISGELYTFSKIYAETKNDNIKAVLENGMVHMLEALKKNQTINVAEGSSGILALLLSIYNDVGLLEFKNKILDLSFETYENIIANIHTETCEHGFVYGIDGVLAFLAEFMRLTESKEVRDTIGEILCVARYKYEEVFKSKATWNKGTSGVLLSRLMLKQAKYKDNRIDTEIKELLEYTIKNGFGNSPYYYNGDIGTIEILEYAAEILEDTALKNRCAHTFNILVKEVIEPLIQREISYGDKSTALLTGILGLGYSLLRKCDESLVPQVLRIQ